MSNEQKTIYGVGIWPDLPDADYYKNPCDGPCYTQSYGKQLLFTSHLHASIYKEATDKMDFGNMVHSLLLGVGKDYAVLEFDSWRTNASKEAAEAAANEGKIAILSKDFKRAEDCAKIAKNKIIANGHASWFESGRFEVAAIAQKEGFWIRGKFDGLEETQFGDAIIHDIKTVDSANPATLHRQIYNMGYDIQESCYRYIRQQVGPVRQVKFVFHFVEVKPPFDVVSLELDGEWQAIGQIRFQKSFDAWKKSLQNPKPVGYAEGVTISLHPEEWVLKKEMQND